MDAIIRFLQDTGFYLFSQDGNWRCLIMLGIACVLLYLGIVKKFEPLLLVPIAFGMLITNLPGANMFHEIFFAGGHIHWDLIGGQPVTASLLADLHSQGVAENVLAPYIQQLMTAAQTTFSPEMVEQAIAAVTEEAGAAITALEAQLQALVQAEQAASYYGMTLSDVTVSAGLVDILYLGVKLGIYPCLIFMGVGAMTDFGPSSPIPRACCWARRRSSVFLSRLSAAALWDSLGRNPAPSASSAARTVLRPFLSPLCWPRRCWVPLPWRPTPIWRWFR